jgi:5-methylcytosine-specific restriction endonuclease McrA
VRSIPEEITREHIIEGIRRMTPDVFAKLNPSTKFDVEFEGVLYPPKEVIRHGYWLLPRPRPPFGASFNAGAPANKFLVRREFTVVDKQGKPYQSSKQATGMRSRRAKKSTPAKIKKEEDYSAFEGKEEYVKHRRLERDPKIALLKKDQRFAEKGSLECDVCTFSFKDRYGDHGANYIEAHHTIPVSEMGGRRKTKLKDLALVCANCHRMLHRHKPWLGMKKLKAILVSPKT